MPERSTMKTEKKSAEPVATICLYGTMEVGAGWLAHIPNGTKCGRYLGDGEPVANRSMTAAVWLAVEAIRLAGVARGTVRIFEPGGQLCADAEISTAVPYFGDLAWKPAPVYAVAATEIMRVASAEVTP